MQTALVDRWDVNTWYLFPLWKWQAHPFILHWAGCGLCKPDDRREVGLTNGTTISHKARCAITYEAYAAHAASMVRCTHVVVVAEGTRVVSRPFRQRGGSPVYVLPAARVVIAGSQISLSPAAASSSLPHHAAHQVLPNTAQGDACVVSRSDLVKAFAVCHVEQTHRGSILRNRIWQSLHCSLGALVCWKPAAMPCRSGASQMRHVPVRLRMTWALLNLCCSEKPRDPGGASTPLIWHRR